MNKLPELTTSRKVKEIAGRFDIDRTTVWRWMKGKTPVPAELVLELEAYTGVSRGRLRPDLYPPDLPATAANASV